jgi:hypothetical protein
MVAAGFNGNETQAQAFFGTYNTRLEEVLGKVAEMLGAQVVEKPTSEPEPEAITPEPAPEPSPLTVEEIAAMGSPQENLMAEVPPAADPPPATFSPKAARALARQARSLKERREKRRNKASNPEVATNEPEDSHGK